MHYQSRTENRIMTYSALAAALIAGQASAAVVQTPSGVTITPGNYLDIDFDGGNREFRISLQHQGENYTLNLQAYFYYTNFIRTNTTGVNAQVLNENEVISGGKVWATNPSGDMVQTDGSGGIFHGVWANKQHKYIGVRFPNSPGHSYGYIRLSTNYNPMNQVTVDGWGYETVYNTAITTPDEESSLPVRLTRFEAVQDGKSINLNWTTESEVENLGFILEKCVTGSGDWKQIASFETHPDLEGQGNTTERTEYQFIDENVEFGKSYDYRLSDVSFSTANRGQPAVLENIAVHAVQPSTFSLHPAYPNPFNPSTTIGFNVPEEGEVTLAVYDLKGQLVTTLLNAAVSAGEHRLEWDAGDVAAGVYFLELLSADRHQMQKITLLK